MTTYQYVIKAKRTLADETLADMYFEHFLLDGEPVFTFGKCYAEYFDSIHAAQTRLSQVEDAGTHHSMGRLSIEKV